MFTVNIGNFVLIKEFLWWQQVKWLMHCSVAACALVEFTGASVKIADSLVFTPEVCHPADVDWGQESVF